VIKSLSQKRFVVIDVETTGLSPRYGDRVIEIGALAIENGTVMEEYSTLIDTNRAINREARQVHGITREMLTGKPKPEEIMPEFAKFIQNSTLVAHNAKFDVAFIRHEFHRQKLGFNHQYICTLEMSQKRLPHLPNHKLGTVYRHLIGTNGDIMRSGTCSGSPKGSERVPGMNLQRQQHRALADARMVAAIWLAMGGK
jgi:DNA polymerase III subunit epsilon